MTKATEVQVGGVHYKQMPLQPVEFIFKNRIPFLEGNVIKYTCRHLSKGGVEDLMKARHYLDMVAEYVYGVSLDELCKPEAREG